MKDPLKIRHEKIRMLLTQATEDLGEVLNGRNISEGDGFFGESREFIVFELAKSKSYDASGLQLAEAANEVLQEIFRDVRDEANASDYIQSLTLCAYGLVFGNYDEEDFRSLYRQSLRYVKTQTTIETWLRKALVFIAAVNNDDALEILTEVRHWIQFLGAPLFQMASFVDAGNELDIDFQSIIESEEYRLVNAVARHPQYLKEAVLNRSFFDAYESMKDWAPDAVLLDLLKMKNKEIYEQGQDQINPNMTVEDAVTTMSKVFTKEDFRSNKRTILPVRLQELKHPPPGDVVDPIIFEMIPQKLRMNLLPSVAYSTKIKHIEIIFLGGHRIGRSGILIKTDTGGVLLDFGLSVTNHRIPEWIPELEMIDTILISHAHLDHVGGLPVLYEEFTGKWCSVGPTGGITRILLDDALKVGTPFPPRKYDKLDLISRYNEENIQKVIDNHVKLEYGQSNEVGPGVVVTPIEACHIPGSAVYAIDIEGVKILYTGDFNIDKSILFPGANPPTDAQYTIFDGTYWGREDFDRGKVADQISRTVATHGPVIIPSFAVGRSQEILLILEELGITKNRNVMVTGMAERVTKFVGVTGNWESMKKNVTHLDEDDVLVAGGGMMSGGLARMHFNEQRNNPKAAIILCGYLAPRTAGWNLLHGYEPHECTVEYARLSAHSSSSNLEKYINSCKGKRIMVHTPVFNQPKGVMIPRYKERIVVST